MEKTDELYMKPLIAMMEVYTRPTTKVNKNPSEARRPTKLNLELYCINETLVDDPSYPYLHHEKYRSNDVSTWNERACKGNT